MPIAQSWQLVAEMRGEARRGQRRLVKWLCRGSRGVAAAFFRMARISRNIERPYSALRESIRARLI